MPSPVNVHRARGKATRIGTVVVLVLVVLLGLLVLPLGGLILIGLGVYIGTQAHRARALPAVDPAAPPNPLPGDQPGAPVRRFFGRKPTYGLSAACTVTGILVFIAGVAVFSSTPPQDQAAPASSAPAPAPALPDAVAQPATSPQPVVAAPPVDAATVPAPVSRQAQPTKAPEKPVQPKPVASQPIAPRPPAAAQPAAPQPAAPKPAAPRPGAGSGGGAPFYKTCADARAAGAAPLRRGDPGYREELDRDGDGKACETR